MRTLPIMFLMLAAARIPAGFEAAKGVSLLPSHRIRILYEKYAAPSSDWTPAL